VSGNLHAYPVGVGYLRSGVHGQYGAVASTTPLSIEGETVTPMELHYVIRNEYLGIDDWTPLSSSLETLTPAEAQPRAAERLAVERINDLRAAADVDTLERDDTLVAAARAHARDMSVRGFYDHVNPDGERARDRVPCGAAETIHRGTLGPMETADDTTWYTRDPSDMAG